MKKEDIMHRLGKYQDMTQVIIALTDWKLRALVSLTAQKEKTEYLQRSSSKDKMFQRFWRL